MNDHLNAGGFAVVGLFVAACPGSVLFYRYARLGEVEVATDC